MASPIYDNCAEMHEIVCDLKEQRTDLFSDLFQYLSSDDIACGLRSDKSAPESQRWIIKIEGIKGAKTLLTNKKYLIHGYEDSWENCSRPQKVALIANMLRRIKYPTKEEVLKLQEKGKTFEFGKLVKPDIEDFSNFLANLGIEWSQEGADVPDLLETKTLSV